jgi:hypothetical protein
MSRSPTPTWSPAASWTGAGAELREDPAPRLGYRHKKRHWNTVHLDGSVEDDVVRDRGRSTGGEDRAALTQVNDQLISSQQS